jgi:hypothetical protein
MRWTHIASPAAGTWRWRWRKPCQGEPCRHWPGTQEGEPVDIQRTSLCNSLSSLRATPLVCAHRGGVQCSAHAHALRSRAYCSCCPYTTQLSTAQTAREEAARSAKKATKPAWHALPSSKGSTHVMPSTHPVGRGNICVQRVCWLPHARRPRRSDLSKVAAALLQPAGQRESVRRCDKCECVAAVSPVACAWVLEVKNPCVPSRCEVQIASSTNSSKRGVVRK